MIGGERRVLQFDNKKYGGDTVTRLPFVFDSRQSLPLVLPILFVTDGSGYEQRHSIRPVNLLVDSYSSRISIQDDDAPDIPFLITASGSGRVTKPASVCCPTTGVTHGDEPVAGVDLLLLWED